MEENPLGNPHTSPEDLDIDVDESPPENPDNYQDEGDDFSEEDKVILMGEDKELIAPLLLSKSKKCAAKYLKEEYLKYKSHLVENAPPHLAITEVLNILLNPEQRIDSPIMLKWIKWIVAGGSTPRDFYKTVEQYDNPTTCSLVWTADFMAYRCRTCGISPCMSLCLECFNKGNHDGHDYNMFKSQGGGACDCGNRAVMEESGFCSRHNGSNPVRISEPPEDLLVLAKVTMPRLLLRFILHCRSHGGSAETGAGIRKAISEFESFVAFLQELCCRGAAMRTVMTEAFCNTEVYKNYTDIRPGMQFYEEMVRCKTLYLEALESIPFGEVPQGYEDVSTLHGPLIHETFLGEILFWTLKFEFPQKLVCLLLNMRPDPKYEDAFARAFVQHYSRISVMLVKSEESDPLSHRVVHVSVQLFSDQKLAYRMTDSYHLLHIMVLSVKKMMKAISVPSTLHDMLMNTHKVVNCMHDIMKNQCYWPLVSDLNNILSHKPIAEKFMSDSRLLQEWFSFLSLFQGMNNNLRELTQHVEYEPQSYYAAFSAELGVSASPLWAMLSHMKDEETQKFSLTVMRHCLLELNHWFREIGFYRPDRFHHNEATFHLPLHRNFALLLCQAVKKQGVKLSDILPSTDRLTLLLVHPLRAQVAFHEIFCELWVRNGLQIKGQAMTYIQCHFCNSMFDLDLFLLQVGASELPKDSFLLSIIERFHVLQYLRFSKQHPSAEPESEANRFKMLESCLVFIATLTTNRHNTGLSEQEIAEKELILLACTKEKTHSELMDHIPEKCASNPNTDFDAIVKKYTKYIEPECQKSGEMREGLYVPLNFVWEDHYDPMLTMTRSLHKKEYQSSLNRFKQYCRRTGKMSTRKASRLWPPYRLPTPVDDAYNDPRRILACRTFHGVLFTILYKSLHDHNYTESMLGLIVYLLELTIHYQVNTKDDGKELTAQDIRSRHFSHKTDCRDGFFYLWYSTDNIFKNSFTVIHRILSKNYVTLQPVEEGDAVPDIEMEEIEGSDPVLSLPPSNVVTGDARPLPSGSELVPYQEEATAIVPSPSASTQINSSELSERTENNQVARSFRPSMKESSPARGVAIYNPRRTTTAAIAAGGSSGACSNASILPSNQGSECGESSSSSSRALVEVNPTREASHMVNTSSIASVMQREEKRKTSSTLSSFYRRRHLPNIINVTSSIEDISVEYLNINESIISLLIKLHSKLSERPGSYRPQFLAQRGPDSRIGDGPFFIAKVLDKLGEGDEGARRCIVETLSRLYPNSEAEAPSSSDEEASSRMREEKRKKAKEWQRKVMAAFNRKQQKFLAKNMPDLVSKEGGDCAMDTDEEEKRDHLKEYDCVICNQSIPSTLRRPLGLIAYLQPTSIHGNRTTSPSGFEIPMSERTKARLRFQRYTMAKYMKERSQIFNQHFDLYSWMCSIDTGWEGGVHVQTCGHHLHLDCHKSYILSLHSQPIAQENGADFPKGEYFCPFCRQLANSVLPISNDISIHTGIPSRSNPQDLLSDIDEALKSMALPNFNRILATSVSAVMEDLTRVTPAKYRSFSTSSSTSVSSPSMFVFISSILRTNLEIELVERGGCLVNQQDDPKHAVKRSSLIPLLHILAYHAKILNRGNDRSLPGGLRGSNWIRQVWSSLSQRYVSDFEGAVAPSDIEVPMLFRDPVSILIHMVLLLPSKIDRKYYKCLVLNVYRLVVARAAVSALRSLPEERRPSVIMSGPLAPLLSMAYNNLRDSPFFRPDQQPSAFSEETWAITEFTSEVREICLTFLRIASLVKAHMMEERLPPIADPLAECGTLERYLDVWDTCSVVNTSVMGRMCGSLIADNGVSFSSNTATSPTGGLVETQVGELSGAMKVWCSQVAAFAAKAMLAAGSLLTNVRFFRPRLLTLPPSFDEVFQYYHQKKCSTCSCVPKDPGICLICGTLVCMRQACCSQDGVFEGVRHALECGAGTAIYLAVLQAAVVVVRHPRVCFWGCIHLDCYGEEDKDLKRGKPLYLSKGRYQLLEEQWLNHLFTHTPHKWIWHNNYI